MTLEEHAKAISDAIQAAYDDGFELDNGEGIPPSELDLNKVVDGDIMDWAALDLPKPTYY
ncbi:hypothetical protein ACFYW9_19415 [Streptomyces sp. NPDC002698]|uniref:hypothetical protein n=1 Tax=Streptomyces sp. NPDC002698 TaxID=3364660 RepID=UPI0036B242BA